VGTFTTGPVTRSNPLRPGSELFIADVMASEGSSLKVQKDIACAAPLTPLSIRQGLTLIHFSAQPGLLLVTEATASVQ
jgi:hypothetical protein